MRGVDRYDEARLQGRLWTPLAYPALRPACWLDAADKKSLTISSGNVTAFTSRFGAGGGSANAGAALAYLPTGWTDGRSPCIDFPDDTHGFNLTTSVTYAGGTGLSGYVVVNRPGAGVNGYWGVLSGSVAGGPLLRLRDDDVLDSLRNFQADLLASPAISTGPMIVGFEFRTSSVTNRYNGTSASNSSDPALTSGLDRIGYDPVGGHLFNVGTDRMAEAIVYQGIPPTWIVQRIEGYLAWKWGVQDKLVATHPYKLKPPLLGV